MSKKQPPPSSAATPAPDYSSCPYWGRGGRYVYDPATGTRTPVVEEEFPAAIDEMAGDPATGEQLPGSSLPPVKGKRNV